MKNVNQKEINRLIKQALKIIESLLELHTECYPQEGVDLTPDESKIKER